MKLLLKLIVSIGLILSAGHAQAQTPSGAGGTDSTTAPQVTVAEIDIGRPTSGPLGNINTGLKLVFLIKDPAHRMLGIDFKNSRMSVFRDNAGTDYLPKLRLADGSLDLLRFFPFAKVSDDGHEMAFSIYFNEAPPAGASKLHVRATLAVIAGSTVTTEDFQNVNVTNGRIDVGSTQLQFGSGPTIRFGGTNALVSVSSTSPLDTIQNMDFLDSSGQSLKSPNQTFGVNATDGHNYSTSISMTQTVTTATVRVTYYADATTIPISFNWYAGIGLD